MHYFSFFKKTVSGAVVLGMGCGGVATVLSAQFAQAASNEPPIYVSLITHNEQPDSGRYPNFVDDEDAFWEYRNALVSYADMLYEEGVEYNWQSAWNFLLAATMYDHGTSSTNGKNIVRYLQEDLGFHVNVHGHASAYNYADDAYLIDALGSAPSGVMGGFIATPAADSELEDLMQVQHGDVYNYDWTPTLLMGGGSFGHRNDEETESSGMWRPIDNEHFLDATDASSIPVIGTYTSDWTGLNELLSLQASGDLDPGAMHTMAIMVDHDEMLTSAEREAVRDHIEDLQDETAAGRIVWIALEDAPGIWESEYGSVPSIFRSETRAYEELANPGDLIKMPCLAGNDVSDPCHAVYYVGDDGKRHAFTNEKVFKTWYSDYDDLVTVTSQHIADFSLGDNVTYRPGVKMVKFMSVPTVYAVSQGGELRAIASESVASALYGGTWNQKIDDIADTFYRNYWFGDAVNSASDFDPAEETAAVQTISENF